MEQQRRQRRINATSDWAKRYLAAIFEDEEEEEEVAEAMAGGPAVAEAVADMFGPNPSSSIICSV